MGLYSGVFLTILLTVMNMESNIKSGAIPDISLFVITYLMTTTLAYMCYGKTEQCLAYIACFIYNVVRSYYWAKGSKYMKDP